MKKYFLTIFTVIVFAFGANAQLFRPADVAKLADYVVSELQLTGTSAQNVKDIYANYGEQMRVVTESKEGLNVKQSKIQALTKEMDDKVKEKLPAAKKADYDIVANHYRKKGVGTSALNQSASASNNIAQDAQQGGKLDELKELSDKLKDEFKKELGVNDAQADQLVKITFEHNVQKRLINQTLKSDATARAEKMKELNTKTNSKVKEILNDQQYKKFLTILIKNGQAQ